MHQTPGVSAQYDPEEEKAFSQSTKVLLFETRTAYRPSGVDRKPISPADLPRRPGGLQPSGIAAEIVALVEGGMRIWDHWEGHKDRPRKIEEEIKRLTESGGWLSQDQRSELEALFVAAFLGDVLGILHWWSIREKQNQKIEAEIKRLESQDYTTEVRRRALEALHAEKVRINDDIKEREEAVKQAKPVVEEKSVKDWLCPPLKRGVDDVFEVATKMAPYLLTLSVTGVITLPITPLLAAGAALFVSRITVAALCDDVARGNKQKENGGK